MKMSLTANQYRSLAAALASVTLVSGAAHANTRYGDIHRRLSETHARVRSLSFSCSGYAAFAEAPAPVGHSGQLLGPESTNYGIETQR
jgi:hypothetical protein